MTANQLAYQANKEARRTHIATEGLRSRELEETARANRVREAETERHNRWQEAYQGLDSYYKFNDMQVNRANSVSNAVSALSGAKRNGLF